MSQELAQTLLSTGIIDAAVLQEALQRQVVFGGSLDTNLLEVGGVTETALLEALSKAYGLPAVGREQIDQIGGHIPRLFPLVFAETYHLVPFRLAEQDFWVLLNTSADEQLLERVRERLQLNLKPMVTTEVRLHYAMHQLYGTALLPRFASLLQKLDSQLPKPRGELSAGPEHVLSWGLPSSVIAPARARGERRGGLDVRGLLARLESASDRDTIVEVLLGAALAVFEYAALFWVQGGIVHGWRGATPDATQRLVRVSLSVEVPSVFQTIYATGGHYLGPLPQNSANAKLLADMGRPAPRAALLAPISVGGKLAAILWADNGAQAVSAKRVAAILLLSQRAGLCFEGLIRRRKVSAQRLIDRGTQDAAAAQATPPPPPLDDDSAASGAAGATIPVPIPPLPTPSHAGGELWVVEEEHLNMPPPTAPAPADALPLQAALEGVAGAPGEQWGTLPLEHVQRPAPTAARGPVELDEHQVEVEVDETDLQEVTLSEVTVTPAGEYQAFSDITDSPEEALDDWEDVLVEAAGLEGSAAAATRKRQVVASGVTWEDVIAEAERASTITPARAPAAVEVAGTVVDERELLFDSLEAQDPDIRRTAIERLVALGSAIDAELGARFPGRVTYNPLSLEAKLLPFRRSSGLLELLAARGASGASVIMPHLESSDPIKRFFAIYFLHAVTYPPALGSLARRLYDTEPRNRYLAADALRMYSGEQGYGYIVQGLRDQLKVPIFESQVATVQVLGQLRDPNAVPSLIPLVVANRAELAGAAASALAVICGQAFGKDVARWAQWWQAHYNKPRAVWLLESLRHPSPAITQIAHNELVLMSGRSVAFDPHAAQVHRDAGIRAWDAWWQQVCASHGGPQWQPTSAL
jgi:hypothetical protein